jgi:hypothetical protein
MICETNYTGLGIAPVCNEAVALPLIADATGTWAFMTTFNGAYHYSQFHATSGQTIVVPARLNEDYTYVFKLYKPDNSIFNETCYSIKTIPIADGELGLTVNDSVVVTTGKLQFTALPGQDSVSYLELVNAKQIAVFIEGAIRQEGTGEEEYMFDKIVGIISFNTELQSGQKITILYFK